MIGLGNEPPDPQAAGMMQPPGGPMGQNPGLMGPRSLTLDDEEVIHHWMNRKQYSQMMRQPYETQWVKNWKMSATPPAGSPY
jgi:hypothetical protein